MNGDVGGTCQGGTSGTRPGRWGPVFRASRHGAVVGDRRRVPPDHRAHRVNTDTGRPAHSCRSPADGSPANHHRQHFQWSDQRRSGGAACSCLRGNRQRTCTFEDSIEAIAVAGVGKPSLRACHLTGRHAGRGPLDASGQKKLFNLSFHVGCSFGAPRLKCSIKASMSRSSGDLLILSHSAPSGI